MNKEYIEKEYDQIIKEWRSWSIPQVPCLDQIHVF